ncbi:MAG: hypothetical protein RLZZ312_1678 [Bacteroidota bacterium]
MIFHVKIFNFFIAILCFFNLGCNGQTSKNVLTVSVSEFADAIQTVTKPQLIDVRTPKEFEPQHIDNAININWNDAAFTENIAKLDKTKPVYIYCLAGSRSLQAANKMAELGFTKIINLEGGILKWNAQQASKPSTAPEKIVGICVQEYTAMLETNKKTVVNFYAEWCAPCKKMAPYLLKIQKELATNKSETTLVRYNADENKTMIKILKIDELPVILIYKNDKIVYRHNGFLSEADLRKKLNITK